MTQIKTKIPAELEPAAVGGMVTDSKYVKDRVKNKTQEEVNADTEERVSTLEESVGTGGSVDERITVEKNRAEQAEGTLDGKIATEKQRAEGVEGGLNTRLQTVEELATISVGGGDIGIGTAADFESDNPSDLAKVPTVGAMLGGANDGVYDISARHSGTKYADLAAALGENGANVPAGVRRGGMSVKFVQSSDNKYVQWRNMTTSFSTTESDWQGVDKEPTRNSPNLVKSGGIKEAILPFEAVIGFNQEIINLNLLTVNNLIILPSNNKWSDAGKHSIIPITDGRPVTVLGHATNTSILYFLKTYNPVAGETADYVGSNIELSAGASTTVNAPSQAKYLYFTERVASNIRTPQSITFGATEQKYQDKLTFDDTPTQNSDNPVKSGGVYSAIGTLAANLKALGYSLIDIYKFDTSLGNTPVGRIYYNTSEKKLILSKQGGTAEEVPFNSGALYTYNGIVYRWNGTDLVMAKAEQFDKIYKLVDNIGYVKQVGFVVAVATNKWASSTGCLGFFYPLEGEGTVYYKDKSGVFSYIARVSNNNLPVEGEVLPLSDGGVVGTTLGSYTTNTKYLYIQYLNNGQNRLPEAIYVNGYDILQDIVQNVTSMYKELKDLVNTNPVEVIRPEFETITLTNAHWWSDFIFINIDGTDELWIFCESGDEEHTTANGRILRYNANTFAFIGRIWHNWGHCNTVHYDAVNNNLLIGNLPGNTAYPSALYIIYNLSQYKTYNDSTVDFNTIDKTIVDLKEGLNMGTNISACWGESSLNGRRNIVYVQNSLGRRIAKIVLGMGTAELSEGALDGSHTDDNDYNGTYEILEEPAFYPAMPQAAEHTGHTEVIQGIDYVNGKILTTNGHDQLLGSIFDDSNKGFSRRIINVNPYKADGTIAYGVSEGMCYKDGYVYQGFIALSAPFYESYNVVSYNIVKYKISI